jgi:hypothetical protein
MYHVAIDGLVGVDKDGGRVARLELFIRLEVACESFALRDPHGPNLCAANHEVRFSRVAIRLALTRLGQFSSRLPTR